MQFDVKKDLSIMALIVIPIAGGFFIMLLSFAFQPIEPPGWPVIITFLAFILMGIFIWQMYTQSYYRLEQDVLRIKFGPFNLSVAYADITAIKPSKKILSGLALSFDRVAIYKHEKLWQLISPADKERFIQEVKKRAKLA